MTIDGYKRLKVMLTAHEGRRSKPYVDSLGNMTIGIGRNLDDTGLRPEEIDYLYANDVAAVLQDIHLHCPWFDALSDARQLVIVDMVFNLGMPRFLLFHKMLDALRAKDYVRAAAEMLASIWARQVGARAQDLAQQMREGI